MTNVNWFPDSDTKRNGTLQLPFVTPASKYPSSTLTRLECVCVCVRVLQKSSFLSKHYQ